MNLRFKTTILTDVSSCLESYRRLVDRVDRMLDGVRSRYPDDIACAKGCDCGCRNISIFPVEALSAGGATPVIAIRIIGRHTDLAADNASTKTAS